MHNTHWYYRSSQRTNVRINVRTIMYKAKQTLVSLCTWLNYTKGLFGKVVTGTWARRITHVYCVVALRKSSASPVIYTTRTFHIPRLCTFIPGGQSPSCDVTLCHMQAPQNESTFYQSLSGHVLKNNWYVAEIKISHSFDFINLSNIARLLIYCNLCI